jgi:6-phosphogluconolactonase (cycloisomerase 2 family)
MLRMRLLVLSLIAATLAGCGDFFTKETGNGGGSDSSTPHFAYVVNSNGLTAAGSISTFTVDSSTGALTAAGTLATPTLGPRSAVIVQKKFLYYGSSGAEIAAYTVNPATGALTQIAQPFVSGNVPLALSANPAGTFLYAANAADNSISAFAIDQTSGALTPIATSPIALPASPEDLKVDALGRFLFVAMPTGTISVFAVNSNTGELSNRQDFAPINPGGQPSAIAVEPSGRFLYVLDNLPGVEPFSINSNSGALTPLSVPTSPPGSGPFAITADTSGSFLYVTDRGSNDVAAYVILGNGRLSNVSGSPFAADSLPQAIAIDPSGQFLYVAHVNGTINIYKLDPNTGAITLSSTATAGTDPRSIVFE